MSIADGFLLRPLRLADEHSLDALRHSYPALPANYIELMELADGGDLRHPFLPYAAPWGRGVALFDLSPAAEVLRSTQDLRDMDAIPAGLVAIGYAHPGVQLLVSVRRDNDCGAIYLGRPDPIDPDMLARHELIADYAPNLLRVADSFTQLLEDCLAPEDDDALRAALAALPIPAIPKEVWAPEDPPRAEKPSAIGIYSCRTGVDFRSFSAQPLAVQDPQRRLQVDWNPIKLTGSPTAYNAELDVLGAGNYSVLRPAAVEAIGELLAPYGELLECITYDGPMQLFRCVNIVGEPRSDSGAFIAAPTGSLRFGHVTYYSSKLAEQIQFSTRIRPMYAVQQWPPSAS